MSSYEDVADLDDVPSQLREEIEHFFVAYKARENHDVHADGWGGAHEAAEVIEAGQARWRERSES